MSDTIKYGLLGGLAALVAVSVLAAGRPAPAPPAKRVVHTDPALAEVPPPVRTCTVDRSGLKMDARPDPGLSAVTEVPVIPTYRSYMPAQIQALVCPASQSCALPEIVPASLWLATDYRTYRRAELEVETVSRGRCVELRWRGQADALWPDADEGVVQWAIVVGEPTEPIDMAAWRSGGGLVWLGDVVYAGEAGSPEVH